MRQIIFILFLGVALYTSLTPSFSSTSKKELLHNIKKITLKKVSKINNTTWNNWLRSYVQKDGKVNYKRGKQEAPKLKKYLEYLLSIDIHSLKSRSSRLAYHINLYNALVIYGVLHYYPIKSVLKIRDVDFFQQTFFYRNKKITLGKFEHEKIFKKFKEPLVHFALNCASYSCPPLKNQAYTGKRLKKQLIWQTKAYLKNKEFFRIDIKNKIFYVIELFKWYKKDLGNPIKFYKRYGSPKINLSPFNFKYISYNWSLNKI